ALAEFRIEGIATNIPVLAGLLAMPEVEAGAVDTRFVERHAASLAARQAPVAAETVPEGLSAATAPMVGLLVSVDVTPGEAVRAGQRVALIEAMKMQMPVNAEVAGHVREILAVPGATLREGAIVALIAPAEVAGDAQAVAAADPRT
ncbi:biotin/lipoyl-containing protein, partial [Acidisphaera rubrifaciens]|uniref:biotin/lipoyl-containing protein n=1 Tax=Acidisphaera rubrifaciens TaxID=50715 RepID=UPI000661FFDB